MSAPAAIRLLEAKREQYRCGSCAYGISIARPLPHRCPMCGNRSWQRELERRSRATL
jgi:predicted RNA-binding Zn-ribbon protein involved in translation (DUF1610 family)